MSNYIEREFAKILARDNELRDAEASEKRKQEEVCPDYSQGYLESPITQ